MEPAVLLDDDVPRLDRTKMRFEENVQATAQARLRDPLRAWIR